MNIVKKIDIILLSIIFIILFWLGEALVHLFYFQGVYSTESGKATSGIIMQFWDELLHSDVHEYYMRVSYSITFMIFALFLQRLLNSIRFKLVHDPFTKILNSKGIAPILAEVIKNPKSKNSYIVLMKLRRLAVIQKVFGSGEVEKLVANAVDRLRKNLQVTFVGGFRFSNLVFIVHGESMRRAAGDLDAKLKNLFDAPLYVRKVPFHMEYNLGVAPIAEAQDYDDLMNKAYKALSKSYTVVEEIGYYDLGLDIEEKQKLFFVGEFYTALKENHFLIYMQPKVLIKTNKIVAFEVLSRWNHPLKGLVSPLEYISQAENSYLISDLTEQTIFKSKKIFDAIKKSGHDAGLSFNLSAKDLISAKLIARLASYLQNMEVDPSQVTFEITESSFIHQPNIAIENLNILSNFGFKISIDDFGTGYSAFSYLKDFPINEIKLDRAFITMIDRNLHNQAIIKNIILLAKDIGASVCAEGIEREQELMVLKNFGCDIGQGYYWSKPLPYDEAVYLL